MSHSEVYAEERKLSLEMLDHAHAADEGTHCIEYLAEAQVHATLAQAAATMHLARETYSASVTNSSRRK